ncbi:UNVERIFIED_CONTAM: guanine nucleotide exchange protein for ADP-robosylation factor [Siphonaria sp. JEL0065]|nr:guanine nucleotide exchange protein for ADP-robosylation factor [Siphonaria sp. JEL0065]
MTEIPRSPSTAAATPGSSPHVFLKLALDQLEKHKETKRVPSLGEAVANAKDIVSALDLSNLGTKDDTLTKLKGLFEPLLIASKSKNAALAIVALDCLGKLFAYNYFQPFLKVIGDPSTIQELGLDENSAGNEDASAFVLPSSGNSTVADGGILQQIVDCICDSTSAAGGDAAMEEKVQLQIVKALGAAVQAGSFPSSTGGSTSHSRENSHSKKSPSYFFDQQQLQLQQQQQQPTIHGAILLRAIRTTFNIFLLAKSPATQIVAQAALTQMIQTIFGRVPKSLAPFGLAVLEENTDTTVPQIPQGFNLSLFDQNMKDVYLVLRALCKLSMKPIPASEGSADLKSNAMRSKLLSLHLIHTIICSHMHLFFVNAPMLFPAEFLASLAKESNRASISSSRRATSALPGNSPNPLTLASNIQTPTKTDLDETSTGSLGDQMYDIELEQPWQDQSTPQQQVPQSPNPTPTIPNSNQPITVDIYTPTLFIHAIKPYLCLSLTRNTVSVIPQVFDVSMELFSQVLQSLRVFLKREVSVIFTEIILPILESNKTSALITFHQRTSLLKILTQMFGAGKEEGGRLLVEVYLNYDCDPESTTTRENIWERLVVLLSKVVTSQQQPVPGGQQPQHLSVATAATTINATKNSAIRPMTTQSLTTYTKEQLKELYSTSGDFQELKKRGVEVLVKGVLGPIVDFAWGKWVLGTEEGRRVGSSLQSTEVLNSGVGEEGESSAVLGSTASLGLGLVNLGVQDERIPASVVPVMDDPTQFETLRMRKQNLLEGIKKFNEKPKRGIQFLLDTGAITSRTPIDIASFLLATEGLDKVMIGEFLGEGIEENISIMHAFVDLQEFTNVPFVTALRTFLQHFRLPGEAQKIDRFMLKFAERYLLGNPGRFSSADTAYVLAYSVIMLNTDQHNSQVKKRMTKADFLKNNRGIDGDQDLPADFMEAIFDEIRTNEIVLKDEQPAPALKAADIPTVTRFERAAETMAAKTEERLKAGIQRRSIVSLPGGEESEQVFNHPGISGVFYFATHYEHVKSMFEIIWMSVYTALSASLQDSEDAETVAVTLEGFKHAITIACMFDMDLERKAFLATLGKFSQLNGGQQTASQQQQAGISGSVGGHEVRPKNLEAARVLLELSRILGDRLGDSGWMDVVLCISSLEKVQRADGRQSIDKQPRQSNVSRPKYSEEVIAIATSQKMTILVDKIFTSSVNLSGPAIVTFVKALCSVSWDEITSSDSISSEHPRMYCLQRLVEISYYNMNRIRLEWTQLWAYLGSHFNQVATHKNSQVSFFALDKLRQLAAKFLELVELPNFKFQKDFLKPFEHVLGNSCGDPKMKDMALTCLGQLIQGKSRAIKSGWKTILGAFTRGARDESEAVVALAFDMVKVVFKAHFEELVGNAVFPDFTACLVAFCKNGSFAKTSLQSVELLKQAIPRIFELLKTPAGIKILQTFAPAVISKSKQDTLTVRTIQSFANLPEREDSATTAIPATLEETSFRFIFPVLFGFHEVTMTCDLEVRARGLVYLFELLKTHGLEFSHDSWEVIVKGVLFPMFDDLKLSRHEHRKIDEREDLTVWLSTTLIQALRQLVELYGFHFGLLEFSVDGLFEILVACMTQENETLARIGSTCLHQFIETNLEKFNERHWDRICKTFVNLFASTTPNLLFFDYHVQVPEAPTGVMAPPEGAEAEALEAATASKEAVPVEDSDRDVGSESMAHHMSSVTSLSVPGTTFSTEIVFQDGVVRLTGRPKPAPEDFQGIILKCVLHLLVVQTLHEILTTSVNKSSTNLDLSGTNMDERIYRALSVKHLLVLVGCFERSYRFAEAFNKDTELRLALFRMGFMKQLPNLLKQECASVIAYISILFKMVMDRQVDRVENRGDIAGLLIPLCYQVLHNFNTMEPGVKNRNLNAWKPVVILILTAMADLEAALFQEHLPKLYEEIMGILLLPDLDLDIRIALHAFVIRVGGVFGVLKGE